MHRELALWRAHPQGVPTNLASCDGPQSVRLLPSWRPNRPVDPDQVRLEFHSTRQARAERWVAHLEMRIYDRSRSSSPP